MVKKIIVFDMDGTIADFYGVEGWLANLNEHNPRPYQEAKPLYKPSELNLVLNNLKKLGAKIVITSWLANNSNKEFDNAVRSAKREWLKKFGFPADEIHLVKYGTNKNKPTAKYKDIPQILIDDNADVRKAWQGQTINANENILPALYKILEEML